MTLQLFAHQLGRFPPRPKERLTMNFGDSNRQRAICRENGSEGAFNATYLNEKIATDGHNGAHQLRPLRHRKSIVNDSDVFRNVFMQR
jgi:hypothetical protein